MDKRHGIVIFGANGSGKTTLGRELARILGFKHMDIEDYHFIKSEMPYNAERSREECVSLMLADIQKYPSFVISAVTGDFGEEISSTYDLGIFMSAPIETRVERINRQAYELHGERVRKGGDMYEQHLKFIDFAKSRPLDVIDKWVEGLACPVIRVDGTEDYRRTAADIASRFYTKAGEPFRVRVAGLGKLEKYRFVVIFSRYQNKWLYCKAKSRDTDETAGGHIEKGETTLEAAKRELYEETGAVNFDIMPLFDYSGHKETEFSYGQVFLADIKELGELPSNFEMEEVRLFDTIPEKMRFPAILPILFEKVQGLIRTQSSKNEIKEQAEE